VGFAAGSVEIVDQFDAKTPVESVADRARTRNPSTRAAGIVAADTTG
jgi:hypothetical protein